MSKTKFIPTQITGQATPSNDQVTNAQLSKALEDITSKFEKRIEDKEARTTEILAIFITLFTFISVNVSIFTKTKDLLTAVVFMLLMVLCSAFLFSFVLISASRQNTNRITSWGLLLSLICLILIILIISFTKWNPVLNSS